MKYYISDLHFYHESMLDKMDKRGFKNIDEMHDYIIKRWNSKVNRRDEVIILGDLSFGDGAQTTEILKRINGRLSLIIGNHDHRFLRKKDFDMNIFEWVSEYKEIRDEGRKVILCHYPIICYNGQYRVSDDGTPKTYMLYGHVHDTHDQRIIEQCMDIVRNTEVRSGDGTTKNIPCNMINCFCMYSDYTPLSLNEWIALGRK